MSNQTDLLAEYGEALAALSAISTEVGRYRALDEPTLLELNRLAGAHSELARTHVAVIAGEIAHRSAPELGQRGLAQRTGYRTPEEFLRATTRATARDAVTAVRVGRLVGEAQTAGAVDPRTGEISTPREPWLAALARAVADGSVSVSAADAIRGGLGEPSENVPTAALADAVARLCTEAVTLDPDRLYRRARDLRDELDAAGIADREQERRSRRGLRMHRLPDGMGRLVWDLDPETYAVAKEVYDRATSPKRGGPRFSDSVQAQADTILADTRTVEQLASDAFLHLLQHGAAANPSVLLGSAVPAVRVLVSATALAARSGHGRIEGQPDPVSIATVERIACSAGLVPVAFDENLQPLDIGREQRLFDKKQRLALAVRDGGCRWGGCERPPSWCEAHHVKHWHRDLGDTNIADGILLCKHHHLLLHNNEWEIEREGCDYWLVPPPDVDPERNPILMPSKSAAYCEFGAAQANALVGSLGSRMSGRMVG